MKSNRLNVRFWQDDSGWWSAQVLELPAAISQGPTLDEARRRIREAISVVLGNDTSLGGLELVEAVWDKESAKQMRVAMKIMEKRKDMLKLLADS